MARSIADGSRVVPEEPVGGGATHFGGSAQTDDGGQTRLSVVVLLGVNCLEATALGVAAFWTGSVALRAQTAANIADVAVGIFLLVGVLSSVRPPDDTHPLGHGRERFFWSLFAALGIFVGGGGLAVEGAVTSALHPAPVDHFPIAYAVLLGTVALDAFALVIALRPLRQQAAQRSISVRAFLRRTTDPAAMTVVVGGACAVVGALVAGAGLGITQATGSATPDTVASALIGLLLFAASAILLRTCTSCSAPGRSASPRRRAPARAHLAGLGLSTCAQCRCTDRPCWSTASTGGRPTSPTRRPRPTARRARRSSTSASTRPTRSGRSSSRPCSAAC
jgi:divalent metal cation (Fe/Co/Zn/Cd) transporter